MPTTSIKIKPHPDSQRITLDKKVKTYPDSEGVTEDKKIDSGSNKGLIYKLNIGYHYEEGKKYLEYTDVKTEIILELLTDNESKDDIAIKRKLQKDNSLQIIIVFSGTVGTVSHRSPLPVEEQLQIASRGI